MKNIELNCVNNVIPVKGDVFDKNGNLIYSKNFKDFRSPNYVKKALQSKLKYRYVYSLTDNVDS